jgi:hypothetical protein
MSEILELKEAEINGLKIKVLNLTNLKKKKASNGINEDASSDEAPSSIHKKEEGKESRSFSSK